MVGEYPPPNAKRVTSNGIPSWAEDARRVHDLECLPILQLSSTFLGKIHVCYVSPPVEPSRKMSEFRLKIQKKHSMFMVYSNSSFLVDNFFCMFCLTHLRNRVNVMAKPTTVLVCPMILDCQTSRGWCGSCKQNFLVNMFFFTRLIHSKPRAD